jgi:hypothetical protein
MLDGFGLVAQLELNRRGLAGGADPATAEPWARYLAETIVRQVGTGGEQGFCHWSNAGAPGIMNAAGGIAYALHRYGDGWSAETREAIRAMAEDCTWDPMLYLTNGDIAVVAAELLAGEALGRAPLWERGVAHLDTVLANTLDHGGLEMNAPLYSAHHPPMTIFLQALRDDGARARARILLEYELLFQAHLYLPGGAMVAPQSRDYAGGTADGSPRAMLPLLWLLIGDPALSVDVDAAYDFLVAAATDYVVPEVIRSIFLDKGAGYTFWAVTDALQASDRTPQAVYNLGLDGMRGIPWQAVVLPGGEGSLGVSYGYWLCDHHTTFGVYSRLPSGSFAVLYSQEPMVAGDTDDTGWVIPGPASDDDPDDYVSELYDFERMVYQRTALLLWDPRARPGVVRTLQYTKAWIPRWDTFGGQWRALNGWRVGQVGSSYFAYRPLGTLLDSQTVSRDGGTYLDLDLGPLSGGIAELATTADFPTIEAYLTDLLGRHLVFTTNPLALEFDAYDFETRQKVRTRLEYRPEKRFVAGVEQSIAQALGHGLMESPWVAWDEPTRVLRLSRECFAPTAYDWAAGTVTVEALPPEWAAPAEVQGVRVEGGVVATMRWDAVDHATTYDVSRGVLSALDGSDYGACQNGRDPDLGDTAFEDAERPPAGDGFFYLVRGTNGPCLRAGTYGRASDGGERRNGNPTACP